MSSEILTIGGFQLGNLIQSRIPFLLVRGPFEMESHFGVLEKIHLRNFSVIVDSFEVSEVLPHLQERKARSEDPIVILDWDGSQALELSQGLAAQGYQNVLFVMGGWSFAQTELLG